MTTGLTTQVLDAVADEEAWRQALGALPDALQDAYFQPDYVRLPTSPGETRALLFLCRRGADVWAHPILLRPVPPMGEDSFTRDLFDVETAYGYGGPLSTTDDGRFLRDSNAAFFEWLRERGVVLGRQR